MSLLNLQTRPPLSDDRDELLASVDLEGMFLAAGMTQGRSRGSWTCPNRDHAQTGATPPVSINGTLWNCHGCRAGGTAVDFLKIAHGIDTAGAFAMLRDKVGSPGYRPPPPRQLRPAKPTGPPPDPDIGRIEGDRAADVLGTYLEARQWSTEAAEAFGLYAVWGRPRPGHPRHARVRHPYRVDGSILWWQDRAVDPADLGPKWDNPAGVKRVPYALDLDDAMAWAKDTDPPSLFVAEGPADVVALWHAAPGAACIGLPGTQGVDRWTRALARLDVLIVTDPDDAGDQAALELAIGIDKAGGRSARLRPPADLDDWRREVGAEGLAAGLQDLAEAADWWTP